MFTVNVINFLLFSLYTGIYIVEFILLIRKAVILDMDYPLSEKLQLVNNALWQMDVVSVWASVLPVSIKLSPPDPISIHARWRYCLAISLSFGGLGPSSQSDSG